jgi:tRNA nucleotidyltransferase (CCA-adding enzyme)
MTPDLRSEDGLARAMDDAYPELASVRDAADGATLFLVGGSVRDLLLSRGRSDIDLVVVGDAAALAARLGAEWVEHERFGTAKVAMGDHEIDIAAARAERYPSPGALPEVEPANGIDADLGRRDFTINAMAIPLQGDATLVDPHGGRTDLESGLLRVLHPDSLRDDPTRALRAARYAARFGFEPDPETASLLRAADLDTVSADRRSADLLRLAAEPEAVRGLTLLDEWGLIEPREGGLDLAQRVDRLLADPPWAGLCPRPEAILAAALGPAAGEVGLAAADPDRPSVAVGLAGAVTPVELALARAMGAEWLDRYLLEWRRVALEIDGADLIAAGVAEGPAVGRGLAEALRRKLDDGVTGRDRELEAALEGARGADGVA